MTGKQKFFFEEDPEVQATGDSGITWDEHADTFFSALEEAGVIADKDSMAPSKVETERYETKFHKTKLLEIEYGIIKEDYVLHITPVHQRKNLTIKTLLAEAVRACILELNKVVPYDLNVRIHNPQDSWEIKAISFVVEKGADAWNFDTKKVEAEVIPEIDKQVTAICMKAP